MAFEYRLTWLEQPAEKVKFREQAHTYKCQNQELLLGRVGTFNQCSGSMTFWCGSGYCYFRH
jgi:hypothetical protein